MSLNPIIKANTWKVVYWSVRVQKILIMNVGTKADKARLSEQGRKNKARKQNVRTIIDCYLVK